MIWICRRIRNIGFLWSKIQVYIQRIKDAQVAGKSTSTLTGIWLDYSVIHGNIQVKIPANVIATNVLANIQTNIRIPINSVYQPICQSICQRVNIPANMPANMPARWLVNLLANIQVNLIILANVLMPSSQCASWLAS